MSNKSTVGLTKKGQYLTTIPKGVAQAMNMKKNTGLEWYMFNGQLMVRVLI